MADQHIHGRLVQPWEQGLIDQAVAERCAPLREALAELVALRYVHDPRLRDVAWERARVALEGTG